MKNKKNIAIFASGEGSNFEAIVKKIQSGSLVAGKCLLITDKKEALVRKKAKKYQIKDIFLDPKQEKKKADYEQKLIKILKAEQISGVVLAGYMRILSPLFTECFKNRILNIHPALLPSFAGKNAIARALDYGCKITGVTVHFVNQKIDNGPIIVQKAVPIKRGVNLSQLEKLIHKVEHQLYPYALKLFLEDKLKIKGRHVEIT